jgi:hypothetical protein
MPEIAPEAPMLGIVEVGSVRNWKKIAERPERKYKKRNLILPSLSSTLSPKIQRYHMFPKRWSIPPCKNIEVKRVIRENLAGTKP